VQRIVFALFAFAMLSNCGVSRLAIPDPTIPHQVAKETEVEIYTRLPDGKLSKTKVRLLKGWWIAGPPVVEVSDPD
jgi:hypothetical protein